MKRLPIDFVILGHKYASALSDTLTSDSSGSVIYYLGERVDYEYFVTQVQQLTKNLYGQMTFIFDTTMVDDKPNLTNYFVYLKAMFPKARIIAVAPGLRNRELISNIYSCGVYDLLTPDVSSYPDSQKVKVVCQVVDTAIDHPKSFADVYKQILWQVPVLEPKPEEPKGLIAKARARREARLARKEAEKQAKEKAKNARPEPVVDPYEAFLNGDETAQKQPRMNPEQDLENDSDDLIIFDDDSPTNKSSGHFNDFNAEDIVVELDDIFE